MDKGIIFNIMKYSVHDGPGIRTTVFLKGCPLSCWWCHNPEGISSKPTRIFHENKCIKCGNCEACPSGARETIGYEISSNELIGKIKKDILFYEQSGGGVTFSGGEPLYQPEFLLTMLKLCKKEQLHTVVDTSGYANSTELLNIIKYTDLFLYDIKFINREKHIEYCGVPNDIILENLKLLSQKGADIWMRVPVIPKINDGKEEMAAIHNFAKELNISKVDLLPYHNIQSEKYRKLGIEYKLADIPAGKLNIM